MHGRGVGNGRRPGEDGKRRIDAHNYAIRGDNTARTKVGTNIARAMKATARDTQREMEDGEERGEVVAEGNVTKNTPNRKVPLVRREMGQQVAAYREERCAPSGAIKTSGRIMTEGTMVMGINGCGRLRENRSVGRDDMGRG